MKEDISIVDSLKEIIKEFTLVLCSTLLENIPIWDQKVMLHQDPQEPLKLLEPLKPLDSMSDLVIPIDKFLESPDFGVKKDLCQSTKIGLLLTLRKEIS